MLGNKQGIIGLQHAVEVFGDFELHQFPVILELRWYMKEESGTPCIDLTASSDREDKRGRIRLRFEGVSDLRIEDWGAGQVRIEGLDIADTSKYQLEGSLDWQLFDYENRMIQFYCRQVEVLSAERV